MSSKLEKLIAAYEAEQASLTAEMEECVAEMAYGKANLFFKGLARVNQQLQTLYNIQDKWHDKKERLARAIEFWEERAATEDGYLLRHLTERIGEEKQKLAELQRASAQKASASHNVRGALDRLLVGAITNCTLIFQAAQRLNCQLRLVRKTLILTIPEVCRHRANYTLEKRHIRYFKRLGFRLYDKKDKLMLFAPYSTVADVTAVQRILARITFEILSFQELTGETFIKYHL